MYRQMAFTSISLYALAAAAVATAQPLRPPELPVPPQGQASSEPGYLGLIADDKQENGRGARLKEVMPESPAAQSGLVEGDLITAVNGHPIHSLDDMGAVLKPLPPGAKVAFDIERHGQTQTVNVTLGNRPPPDQRKFHNFGRVEQQNSPPGQPSAQPGPGTRYTDQPELGAAPRPALLGVKTLPVDEQTRARLRLPSNAGALVIARTLGSPAEKANIPLDAVIVALDGQRVGNPNELSALLAQAGAGKSVELTYLWNGETARSNVTLGVAAAGLNPTRVPTPGGAASDIGRAPPGSMPNAMPNTMRAYPTPGTGATSPNANVPSAGRSDAQRVEALEQRVRELEEKVRQLEDQVQRRT
jgi:predicted metalloprotease with PDZ domain